MSLIDTSARAVARRRAQASAPAPSTELIDLLRHRQGTISPTPQLLAPGRRSVKLEGDHVERAVREGYQKNAWLFAAIRTIARSVMSIPILAEVNTGDGWEPPDFQADVGAARLQQLVDNPSPRTTRAELLERMTINWNLAGKVLMHKTIIPERLPQAERDWVREVRMMTPIGWTVEADPDEEVRLYRYKYQGVEAEFTPEEVIDIIAYDPGNPLAGIAGARVADRAIASDNEAQEWQLASYANRAVGDGALVAPEFVGPRVLEQTKERLRERQGSRRAREPIFLTGGWRWQDMSRTPVEMDFIASREHDLILVCAVLGVNPALLKPDAKYSNLEVAEERLWKGNVIPFLDLVTGKLNADLVPHFGTTDRLRLGYDVSDVEALAEDVGKKVKTFHEMVSAGVPYNDAVDRLDLGIPHLPAGIGDMPHGASIQVVVGQQRGGGDDPQPDPAGDGGEGSEGSEGAVNRGGGLDSWRSGRGWVKRTLDRTLDVATGPRAETGAEEASGPLFDLQRGAEREHRDQLEEALGLSAEMVDRDRLIRALEVGGSTEDLPAILGVDAWTLGVTEEGEDGEVEIVVPGMAFLPSPDAAAAAAREGHRELSAIAGVDVEPDEDAIRRWAEEDLSVAVGMVRDTTERAVDAAVSDVRGPELRHLWRRAKDEGLEDEVIGLVILAAGLTAPEWARLRRFVDEVDERAGMDEALRKANLLATQLRAARADRIATDTAVRAVWGGNIESARDSVEAGRVLSAIGRWLHSGDMLVCEVCLGLGGVEAKAGEPFISTFNGRAYYRPGDPHPGTCRCGQVWVEVVV